MHCVEEGKHVVQKDLQHRNHAGMNWMTVADTNSSTRSSKAQERTTLLPPFLLCTLRHTLAAVPRGTLQHTLAADSARSQESDSGFPSVGAWRRS